MKSKPLSLMGKLLKKNMWPYIGAGLCTVFTVIIAFLTPILLAETIDTLLGGKPSTLPQFVLTPIQTIGGRDFLLNNLWVVGLVLILLNVVNGVFTYLKGRWSAMASENISRTLRNRLYSHLQHLPFSFHAKAETGDLIQRCTSDVDTVRRFLSVQLIEVINTILMVTIAITILWQKNVSITLYSMILIPILFFAALIFYKNITSTFREADVSEGKMSAVLQENLTGVRVVRAFGQEQWEVEKFDAANGDFRHKVFRMSKLLAIYWAASDGASILQSIITLLVCVYYACQGWITVGTLIIFTSYIGMLLYPIRQLGRILSDAGKCKVSLERIQQILDEKEEAPEPDAVTPPMNGDITFSHVSFHYEEGQPILNDVSFTIKAGKTIALLGGTGSGKSTLVALLQRLVAPTAGEITIGGVPIQSIDRKYLRSKVGLVLQEPFLYSKTIRDNVGIARREWDMAGIETAARTACAQDFIVNSEQGYDTLVGERGVTLSGGQKQRIAIARTLMKDNDILIFDDSLSAVDTETDAQIRKALKERQKDVTTLIISHRITTLQEADFILVMEDGCIIDQGNHQELCSHPGLYQRINHIQNTLEEELEQSESFDNTPPKEVTV